MEHVSAFEQASIRSLPSDKLKKIHRTLEARMREPSSKMLPGDYDIHEAVQKELAAREPEGMLKSGRDLLSEAFSELFRGGTNE